MLQHPHVEQVAGSRETGFFRRWWEGKGISADTEQGRLEAYSWGGLTSGDNQRALWLLLLPFMLLNVAFFMTPWRQEQPGREQPARGDGRAPGKAAQRFTEAVHRLFALTFTGTFTLAAVSVSMDLLAWQCGSQPADDEMACAKGVFWTDWLRWGWLDSPERRVV